MFRRLATVIALLISSLASAQTLQNQGSPRPVAGIRSFETSRFCRDYDCLLETIEPLRINGEITDWFYDYRVSPKGTNASAREYQMRIGMRLIPEGDRPFQRVVVRWFPITAAPGKEFAIVSKLISEITGETKFNSAKYLADYAASLKYRSGPHSERGPSATVGTHTLQLSITRGPDKCRYPQLTLIID